MDRDPKMAATTNGVSGRGEGTIPLVSGRAMVSEGKLTVYNHRGGGVLLMHIPQAQPYESDNIICCYR